MKKDIIVAAEPRESRGKNNARRLRVQGLTPAVVYGTGGAAVALSVSPKEVNRILHSKTGHNTIFNLDVKGVEQVPVMIVDWQHDPVKGNLLHVDLQRIDLSKRIKVKVPVHTEGDPKGVKQQGGLMEAVTREIEIECLPDDIPEHFVMNVTELLIGQSVRASDVPMTGSMKLLSLPDTVICHVIAARVAAAETTTEEAVPGGPAEPEVVKKGKKEEEGAAEAKPKKK